MQFPTIPSRPVKPANAVEVRAPDAVRPSRPVMPGPAEPVPHTGAAEAVAGPPGSEAERRAAQRRGRADDRRQGESPVLLDTRSGQERRRTARRTEDPPATGIDVTA